MTNVARYNVNFVKLIIQRIPKDLQIDEFINWVNRLCDTMVFIYNLVIAYRNTTLYNLSITSQVFSLEKMLNDRYDNALRRIYIDDGILVSRSFEYLEAEGRTFFVYTEAENHLPHEYDYLEGELFGLHFNFIVHVPGAITFNIDEMKGLLDTNKLAGKTYSIQTF
jgi:hypothetical protein